jgi:hypothetical protein
MRATYRGRGHMGTGCISPGCQPRATFFAVHKSAVAQGFGCRPSTAVQHPLAAGVRKPPRNEPAEDGAERLPPVRYGELSGAESVGIWRHSRQRLSRRADGARRASQSAVRSAAREAAPAVSA